MRDDGVVRAIKWAFVVFWLVVALWVIRGYDSTSGTNIEREDTGALVDDLEQLGG